MKRLLFVMTLFVSAFTFADFAKYIEMTVNYTPTASVDGFPVLVRLNSSRINYADVKNAGADLKFTDASGETVYPHEVDTWNASGESLVWVRLPQLDKGAKFRMYYGDATVTTSPSSTPVWQGYERVLHAAEAKDSAKGGLTGLCEGGRSVNGPVGLAYGQTAAGGKASIECDLSDHDSTQFTVSGWMRLNVAVAAWTAILGPRNGATASCWGLTTNSKSLRVNVAGKDTGLCNDFSTEGLTPVGEWAKFDIVYNDLTTTFYINGQMVESPFTTTKPACRVVFQGGNRIEWMYFGGIGTGQNSTAIGLSGTGIGADFDECRILNTPASAARVAADYATVKNADFLTFQAARDNIGDPGSVLVLH